MPSGAGGRRDHWQDHARNWANQGPPLRPSGDDVEIVERAIAGRDAPGGGRLRALLLGVTPEIATCRWPAGTELLAIDRSAAMVQSVWPAAQAPAGSRAICADWLAMPVTAGRFDIAVGDGCYITVDFPEGARALGREAARVLAPGGHYVIRAFLRPDRPEPLGDIARDLRAGAIGGVNALKLRLFAAIHGSTGEGVRLADVWRLWQELSPLVGDLGVHPGWTRGRIATIEVYRGLETRYYLPTLGDFRAAVAEHFEELWCAAGRYELADRCMTFALRRRGR